MKLHKLTGLVGTLLMAINVSAKPLEFLVPAYFYPAGEALKDWKQLAETAKSVPVNVIINPGFYLNGTRTLDANYIDVVKLLHK